MRHVHPRNEDVVEAFANGLPAGWWEVARWHGGETFIRNGPTYSMTSAMHRNAAGYWFGWSRLSAANTPREAGRMLVARGHSWDNGETSCVWLTKRPRRGTRKLDQLCVGCKRRWGLLW